MLDEFGKPAHPISTSIHPALRVEILGYCQSKEIDKIQQGATEGLQDPVVRMGGQVLETARRQANATLGQIIAGSTHKRNGVVDNLSHVDVDSDLTLPHTKRI